VGDGHILVLNCVIRRCLLIVNKEVLVNGQRELKT
jgi:hypothetical protein